MGNLCLPEVSDFPRVFSPVKFLCNGPLVMVSEHIVPPRYRAVYSVSTGTGESEKVSTSQNLAARKLHSPNKIHPRNQHKQTHQMETIKTRKSQDEKLTPKETKYKKT